MHIYLTGFMGAGKSTVGKALARLTGRPFVDLDERIEARQGQAIAAIFDSVGEPGFREVESEVLRELPDRPELVVALGGGAQSQPENRTWLAEHGVTVWLDLPWDTLVQRVRQQEAVRRPLFRDEARARELYEIRLNVYGDSDLRIEISSQDSVESVTARIWDLVEETSCDT